MAITSLYLPRTLRRPIPYAPRDHLRREKAIELYEAGEHRAAIDEAVGYLLLPGQPAPDLSNTPLCLVQGTARVRLHIEGDRFVVRAVLGALPMEGAATAALLWELSRHLLLWYFGTLSQISTVYGSLTTAIAVLLSLEVAATLLLLGAQVIAEYERTGRGDEKAPPRRFHTD